MDTDHREHSVMVWGEPHIVTVCRKSETVYGRSATTCARRYASMIRAKVQLSSAGGRQRQVYHPMNSSRAARGDYGGAARGDYGVKRTC